MKAFLKRLVLFLGIAGMLLIIVGCGGKGGGGGGGSGGGGLDNVETKQAIDARIKSFRDAVQAYDVQGMLDFLEETTSAEQLTIAEGKNQVHEYPKSYKKLKSELEEDEPNQKDWRKPPAEGGYGYTLTMDLGTIAYSNLAASGAFATVPFTIKEAAAGIQELITDQGHMVCEMVKVQGTWRCQEMKIVFYGPDEISASSMASFVSLASYRAASRAGTSKDRTKAFGFGDPETFLKNNGLL